MHTPSPSAKKKAPIVVALVGKTGVGKDTIANLLAPHGFARIAFADALRNEIAEAWRIPVSMLTDRTTKEWPIPALAVGLSEDTVFMCWCHDQGESLTEPRSPRWLMQNWADYKRRFKPDHYAQIVARWIRRQIGTGWNRIVITDLRDPVEALALAPFDGVAVRVIRPGSAPLSDDTANHRSERHEALHTTHCIVNDGTLEDLAVKALGCLQEVGMDVAALAVAMEGGAA